MYTAISVSTIRSSCEYLVLTSYSGVITMTTSSLKRRITFDMHLLGPPDHLSKFLLNCLRYIGFIKMINNIDKVAKKTHVNTIKKRLDGAVLKYTIKITASASRPTIR